VLPPDALDLDGRAVAFAVAFAVAALGDRVRDSGGDSPAATIRREDDDDMDGDLL
jgi:hypothetical protein